MLGIGAVHRQRTRRSSKHGFWPGLRTDLAMARRTGVDVSWVKSLGVSHMMVARVWAKQGLRPHRLERYMTSNDPKFEDKAAEIIGLYLNPPSHAAVFCVDEKSGDSGTGPTGSSAAACRPEGPNDTVLNTTATVRSRCTQPLTPRQVDVLGKTAPRHTSAEFVAFLADIVANQPKGKGDPCHLR